MVFASQEEESILLRQKIAALEERVADADCRRHELEDEFAKNRRLVKLLEKYKCELNDANADAERLKNSSDECDRLRVSVTLCCTHAV